MLRFVCVQSLFQKGLIVDADTAGLIHGKLFLDGNVHAHMQKRISLAGVR